MHSPSFLLQNLHIVVTIWSLKKMLVAHGDVYCRTSREAMYCRTFLSQNECVQTKAFKMNFSDVTDCGFSNYIFITSKTGA